ncbi:MAG TPA: hypothetical protein PKD99_01835 [Sphingopyxis sp.]|nr:hypothetical protein [Sphingopyxis sp.]HMP43817.1 hypothetical protein [Sphingopyxis sp.]
MADHWTQGSFAFRCVAAERALIEEAVNASRDLCAGVDPDPPSAAILSAFPPTDSADPWSGFRAAFGDYDHPHVGGDFAAVDDPDDAEACLVTFASMDDFEPDALAMLIQRCCPATLAEGPIGFEWAAIFSKPRIDQFGGGWCAIFADRIELESTGAALDRALSGGID